MSTVWRVFKGAKRYWGYLIIGCICLVISAVAGFYTPWALREFTELATRGDAQFASEALRIGLVLLVATAIQAVTRSAAGYLNHYGALQYVALLRSQIYGKLQNMSLQYFNKSRTGDLTNRLVNDSIQAEILMAHVIPDFIINIVIFIGVGILLLSINVKLALISLITIPFLLGITIWQSKRLSPLWTKNVRIRSELSSTTQDNLSGIKEIQIFNRQQYEENKISELALQHTKAYLHASFFYEVSYPLLAFFVALGTVIVIIFGGRLVASGEVGVADIIGFVAYLSMFYGPVQSFSGLIEMSGEATAACHRVFEVIDETPDVNEKEGAIILPRVHGDVTFKNICFAYNPDMPVLENINLEVKAGQTVAFVGATGVGKSTITSLLNRFYDPQSGAILIDGIDIRDVTLSSLRDNISMVLQDTFLFNGTVYDNIAYGWKDATYDEVITASKAAKAHDFIMKMENGYDTIVGERGVRLSGGQKQRVSIARAILRNSPILILDEATSALDTKTEKEIQIELETISKKRTTFIIAHRLSTIKNADIIVVLQDTIIAEIGTHDTLISNNDVYSKLQQIS